jgi:anaerobic magnesium-protoporphyrin IX monomethyl ester cyclase
MVDVLLIQPPVRDFYRTAKRTVPYGLASIAAALENAGFTVEILDALATDRSRPVDMPPEMAHLSDFYGRPDTSPFALFHRFKHFGYSFEHIAAVARRSGAFLVGISSLFTPYSELALRTAETVRTALADSAVVLGGHHPTALPEAVMENSAVDFVLRGDGELSMPLLAAALKKGEDPADIPGLVRRRKNGRLVIGKPARCDDPNRLPLPAGHLINHRFYRRGKKGSVWVVAGRGCPLACSYCSMRKSVDRCQARRSVESVMAEIETAVTGCDAGFIDFEDENLSWDREWFLRLLGDIRQRFGHCGLELRAMNGLFPPSLDDDVVGAMAESGFRTLNLSLGSASAAQLRRFQRPQVVDAFERALDLALKYRLQAVGYIIAGAPDQTAVSSVDDLLFLAARRVLAGVSIFYPSPGTPDFQRCRSLGVLPDRYSLMRSSALPVAHTTSRVDSATILRLGRILNFIKALVDRGIGIPEPLPIRQRILPEPQKRETAGIRLLEAFLDDGKIRGVRPDGRIYSHHVSMRLTRRFLDGLKGLTIRGCT